MKKTRKPKPTSARSSRPKVKESGKHAGDIVSFVTICMHCEGEAKTLESQHRYVCLNGDCALYGIRLAVHHSAPHWD